MAQQIAAPRVSTSPSAARSAWKPWLAATIATPPKATTAPSARERPSRSVPMAAEMSMVKIGVEAMSRAELPMLVVDSAVGQSIWYAPKPMNPIRAIWIASRRGMRTEPSRQRQTARRTIPARRNRRNE